MQEDEKRFRTQVRLLPSGIIKLRVSRTADDLYFLEVGSQRYSKDDGRLFFWETRSQLLKES